MNDLLKITPIKQNERKRETPPLMAQIGLKHPFSITISGCTGSGKTLLLLNLLTKPQMYRNFFYKIYLFSATGRSDPSFKVLGLPEEHVITDNFIYNLDAIIAEQEEEEEKAEQILIIFEDLTANKKLMRSKSFLKVFVQNRHMNISVIATIHKYHSLIREARLNSNHIFLFPCSNSEQLRIMEEYQTPFFDKKRFLKMLKEAFTPDEISEYPFLWINSKSKIKDRFRKNLGQILY